MPQYHFHPLPDRDAPPVKVVVFSDMAAGRIALGPQFPGGCDVWQGTRYVGRFHRSESDPVAPESLDPSRPSRASP